MHAGWSAKSTLHSEQAHGVLSICSPSRLARWQPLSRVAQSSKQASNHCQPANTSDASAPASCQPSPKSRPLTRDPPGGSATHGRATPPSCSITSFDQKPSQSSTFRKNCSELDRLLSASRQGDATDLTRNRPVQPQERGNAPAQPPRIVNNDPHRSICPRNSSMVNAVRSRGAGQPTTPSSESNERPGADPTHAARADITSDSSPFSAGAPPSPNNALPACRCTPFCDSGPPAPEA